MKKIVSFFAIFAIMFSMFAFPVNAEEGIELIDSSYDYTRFQGQGVTINVYNWGEYISDGGDGSLDVIAEFEALTGIRVNYTMFATNEEMYTKLKSGGANYDVIIPSDYMIKRMADEGMLAELNYDNIPNAQYIGEQYSGREYDPQNQYSVPYMWGLVGIVYNTTMVEGEVTSWSILWDETYAGNILMFNNSRDAFAIAAFRLGLEINPTTEEEIAQMAELLKQQKTVVQMYVMDEIFDKMEGGEAAVAPYYAGDAITMMEENPDLAFVIPEEGTNYFVDAMCIPATSQNQEAAEMFINFMCETEIAAANAEYTGYSTPHMLALEALPEEIRNNPIAYPTEEVMENTAVFTALSDEVNASMDIAWADVKSFDPKGNSMLMPIVLGVVLGATVLVLWQKNKKKKKVNY